MAMDESVRKAVLGAVPSLRAFAISLCGNVDRADDLVQETLLRALANINSFQPGTNMSAWLFTILRNHFRSEYRKRRREVEDGEGHYAETLKSQPEQHGQVEFREFREALAHLPSDQREALILVGASGFSYEEAANICGCAVGTIKSRVNRARTRLAELMSIDSADEFGPDEQTRAVLAAASGRKTAALGFLNSSSELFFRGAVCPAMDTLRSIGETLLGLSKPSSALDVGQLCLRAAIVYLVMILFMRLAKKRSLGRATVFDAILGIIIGSIASRAITGNAPFFGSLAAVLC